MAAPREAEPQPSDAVLALQRAAGNRAVSALLARQPSPTAPETKPAKKESKAATSTLGLGEDIGVIPLDSVSLDLARSEISVVFASTPLDPTLIEASVKGRAFPTAFLSTTTTMSKMTDVYIATFLPGSTDGGRARSRR